MVNLNEEAYSILNNIAPTYYQYPQILVDSAQNQAPAPQDSFPMISYYDSDHSADGYADGANLVDTVEITADVWERADINTGVLASVYQQVDTAMRQNKYLRTGFVNQYEEDTKIYHYTYKFKKIAEEAPL